MTHGTMPLENGQLVLLGLDGPDGLRWHASRVALIETERVWVEEPSSVVESSELPIGGEIQIETSRLTDARYTGRARVLERSSGPPGLLALDLLSSERIQRRAFFRMPLSVRAERATVVGESGQETPLTLYIRDISAAGLRLRIADWLTAQSTRALAIGDQLRLRFRLPDQLPLIELTARVVRVADEEGTEFACEVGAAFDQIPNRERERIIQFTLSRQAEHRRRGLL